MASPIHHSRAPDSPPVDAGLSPTHAGMPPSRAMTSHDFRGVIARTHHDSTPWWPAPHRAPRNSPNILLLVLDDVGFAQLSCFGSDIATPTLDRLANGLRYTNFHT